MNSAHISHTPALTQALKLSIALLLQLCDSTMPFVFLFLSAVYARAGWVHNVLMTFADGRPVVRHPRLHACFYVLIVALFALQVSMLTSGWPGTPATASPWRVIHFHICARMIHMIIIAIILGMGTGWFTTSTARLGCGSSFTMRDGRSVV